MPRPQPGLLIDDHVPEASWSQDASCKGLPPERNPFFDDDDPDAVAAAKAICSGCTIRPMCLEQALVFKDQHGIWGGLTPAERRTLMKRRRQAA